MPFIDMRADHRQSQTLSPRLQHAVRLLQMSSLDFAAMVRDTLDKNPFLEPEDGADEHDESLPGETVPQAGAADGEAGAQPTDPGHDDDLGSDRDLWHADGGSAVRQADDGEMSAMDTMPVETALNVHLHGQLNVLPLPPRDLALARTIDESLDDDGYLRTPLTDAADALPLSPPPEPQELSIALRLVQALDPAGVGARDVAECLQLQLRATPAGAVRDLAQAILARHLRALAAGDLRTLARRLGQPLAAVEAACAAIRRLDPHPGWRFSETAVQYVTPDIFVRKVRGQWVASLNDAVVPRVKLNRSYVELFQRHREPRHAELGAHLQEARWTVRNVEQRFSTILSVARAILKRQQHFLAYGAMAMKPLALREIADEVGVHESTVSRVTNNKFMATPCGVFELKYFFSRGLATASGGECSPTAIRGLIQEMIAAEPPAQPLSDVEIARALAGQGLRVARRTVTKYRQLLRIEPAERRRPAAGR